MYCVRNHSCHFYPEPNVRPLGNGSTFVAHTLCFGEVVTDSLLTVISCMEPLPLHDMHLVYRLCWLWIAFAMMTHIKWYIEAKQNFLRGCDNAWRVMKKNALRPFNVLDMEARWKRFCILCTRSKRKPRLEHKPLTYLSTNRETNENNNGSTVRRFHVHKNLFRPPEQHHFFDENNAIFTVETEWNRKQFWFVATKHVNETV